jgi:hypothetical protein
MVDLVRNWAPPRTKFFFSRSRMSLMQPNPPSSFRAHFDRLPRFATATIEKDRRRAQGNRAVASSGDVVS